MAASPAAERLRIYGITAFSARAASSLGLPRHIVHVRAMAAARSKTEFADLLIAAGLLSSRSRSSAIRQAGEVSGRHAQECLDRPRQVLVFPMEGGHQAANSLAWPPTAAERSQPK